MLFIQNPNDFHTLNYRSCHWCWLNLCSKHIVSEKITIYLAMFGGSISFVWTISALVSSTYTHYQCGSSVKMYFSLRWMFLVRVSYTTKTVYYSIHPISIDSNILFFSSFDWWDDGQYRSFYPQIIVVRRAASSIAWMFPFFTFPIRDSIRIE